jgi:MtN3 and saliva related transmembrane protein
MLDTALAVCAAAWGVVMALSPLLQIRRMISQQSSRDVSIGYFCVLLGVPMRRLAIR